MLTPERIDEIAGPADYWDRRVFARAIESVACAPLLERIAELEAKLSQRGPSVDALTDKIASLLGLTYHCTRVWEAWNVGTMSQDDFEPVDESDTPREIAEEVLAMLAAAPAAPEQQEPKHCSLCGSDEPFSGACGGGRNNPSALCYQALNAQQATPSCESKTVDSESQPSLSARGSQQEQSELPPGWKTVVVPEEVGPEPDWEDVRYQAETATGIELPRAVFSIVIREVRRWLAAQQTEAQPVAWSTFDGEGGHDYRSYDGNETYREEYEKRNPQHKNWVQPLYTAQPKAVPLTHAQINAAYGAAKVQLDHIPHPDVVRIVRAVEAAHGIGTGD